MVLTLVLDVFSVRSLLFIGLNGLNDSKKAQPMKMMSLATILTVLTLPIFAPVSQAASPLTKVGQCASTTIKVLPCPILSTCVEEHNE
jgi:hypothetical protein